MLLKMSVKMCAILRWMCWGWQCGVNMHHHDLAIIISLQTHPAKLVSSWCMAPTLWCKDLLFLLRKVQTSSAHSCPSDTHLLNLASLQLRNYFHLGVDTKEEYPASSQHEHSLKFVVEKNLIIIVMAFLHTFWQSTNLRSSMHEQCSMTT